MKCVFFLYYVLFLHKLSSTVHTSVFFINSLFFILVLFFYFQLLPNNMEVCNFYIYIHVNITKNTLSHYFFFIVNYTIFFTFFTWFYFFFFSWKKLFYYIYKKPQTLLFQKNLTKLSHIYIFIHIEKPQQNRINKLYIFFFTLFFFSLYKLL